MSLLENLVKQFNDAGGLQGLLNDNPQIAEAALQFLGSDPSVGPSDGLHSILAQLQSSGLGDAVASWLGSGANHSVSGHQVQSALGTDTLSQFARQAGIDLGQAGEVLAGLLPALVNGLSAEGSLPDTGGLDQLLGSLFGQRG